MHDMHSQLKDLRLVLVCIVVIAVHGLFLVEQPRQTHLFNHFRWQWFQEKICYVPCLLCMCFQAVVEPIMHDFWFDNDFC